MVAQLGMSQKLGPVDYQQRFETLSSETKAMIEAEVKKTLDDAYVRARTLLVSKRKELDLVAKALVQYETLDRTEIEKVMRGETLEGRIAVPPGPMAIPAPENSLDPELPGLPPFSGGDADTGANNPRPPPPAGGLVAGQTRGPR
jgi:ATP-dependent metalloprotease